MCVKFSVLVVVLAAVCHSSMQASIDVLLRDYLSGKESSAAATNNVDQKMLKMIINYMVEHGGDGSYDLISKTRDLQEKVATREDAPSLNDDEKKALLEKYLTDEVKKNMPASVGGTQTDDEAMKAYIEQYLSSQKMLANAHWSGFRIGEENMAKQLMDGANTDTLKTMMRSSMAEYMTLNPQTHEQQMLYALVRHALSSPDNELLKKMVMHAVEQAHGDDKGFLIVLFQHMVQSKEGSESQVQLAKSLLEHVLSNGDFASEHPKQVLYLLLQHYVGMSSMGNTNDKNAIGIMLLQSLQSFGDEESSKLAAQLVYHMITAEKEVEDIPEEERWKWFPPQACRIESNGQLVDANACPHNLQCSVGPADVTLNNTNYKVTMCAMPSTYLLFHSCNVTYTNGTLVYANRCPTGQCNVGPVRVQWSDPSYDWTVDLDARFCSDIPNNFGEPKTIIDRACAVHDSSFYIVMQRHCPLGFSCSKGPFVVDWNNGMTDDGLTPYQAYVCMENKTNQQNFMSEILQMVLGVDNGMMSEMPGQNMTAISQGADKEFLKYLMNHISENIDSVTTMVPQDPDTVGLLILHHYVEELKKKMGSAGLAGDTLEILSYKKKMYGLDASDRKVMQMLILHFVHAHEAAEAAAKEDSLKDLLHQHVEDHKDGQSQVDIMKMLLKHWQEKNMQTSEDDQNTLLTTLVKTLLENMKGQTQMPQDSGMGDLLSLAMAHVKAHSKGSSQQEELLKSLLSHISGQMDMGTDNMDHKKALQVLLEHLMKDREAQDFISMAYMLVKSDNAMFSESKRARLMLMVMYARIEEVIGGHILEQSRVNELQRLFLAEALKSETTSMDYAHSDQYNMMSKLMEMMQRS